MENEFLKKVNKVLLDFSKSQVALAKNTQIKLEELAKEPEQQEFVKGETFKGELNDVVVICDGEEGINDYSFSGTVIIPTREFKKGHHDNSFYKSYFHKINVEIKEIE